jgi:predicted permease
LTNPENEDNGKFSSNKLLSVPALLLLLLLLLLTCVQPTAVQLGLCAQGSPAALQAPVLCAQHRPIHCNNAISI